MDKRLPGCSGERELKKAFNEDKCNFIILCSIIYSNKSVISEQIQIMVHCFSQFIVLLRDNPTGGFVVLVQFHCVSLKKV